MDCKEVRQDPIIDLTSNARVVHGRRMSLPARTLLNDYNQPHTKQDQMMSIISSSGLVSDKTVQRRGRRKSWKNILRMWSRNKTTYPSMGVEKSETDSKVYKSKPRGHCIRVVVTEINPQAYYKTLEIDHHTTVCEVIVKLIQNYALKDKDRDPNEYYLTEVKEGHQGNYSRVLSNSDQLYEIQSKWDAEEECYFALYGTHPSEMRINVDPSIKDKFEQPDVHMRPMIISPSQDSFYNIFPDSDSTDLPLSYVAPPSLPFASPPTIPTTNQDPSSFHGISCIISKLTMSPSEKSETSAFELTTSPLHSKPIEQYVNFSYPKIEAVVEHAGEEESRADNKERRSSDSGWREDTKAAQRQQMHKSINMGMQEIMAKVVLETKWNSPSRRKIHSHRSSVPSKPLIDKLTLLPRQDTTIRNLCCSPLPPMQVNWNSYPDFKFLPSPDYGTSDIMKDEVFCRAAERGMMEPKSKEYHQTPMINTTSILRDILVRFPVKEIVTDLDLAALNKEKKKRYRHPFQRHSIREITTTCTSEKPNVMFRERKASLDGDGPPRIRKRSTIASNVPNSGVVVVAVKSKTSNKYAPEKD